MRRVRSRAQAREFDRLASEKLGVASAILMENAGRGAAGVIARELGLGAARAAPPRVLVVCGAGNNGGDGYVVARRLALLGADVDVWSAVEVGRLGGDAATNQRACERSLGPVKVFTEGELEHFEQALNRNDAAVDALFGTGLERPIEGSMRQLIERLNAAPLRRFALDLPSGIDADTGAVHGVALRAHVTITFAAHKLGLLTPSGAEHAGHVELVDIGVDERALGDFGHDAELIDDTDVGKLLQPRAIQTHKSSSGRVLVLAGSPGKVGAALLVAEGALRAGAGLVTLAGVPALSDALDRRVLEAMTARLDPDALEATLGPLLETTNAVAIGSGLGFDAYASSVIERVALQHEGVVVVDADAISHFKGAAERLTKARGPRILTPHSGELARLLGSSAAEVEADRYAAVSRAVELSGATVLLKGPHTLVGSPGRVTVVGTRGSPALASGGSGDVLGGVIAALCCVLPPCEAAFASAYLHARVGEMWAHETKTDRGLLAHEIAARIPLARTLLTSPR